jgi:hypothetical protein
MTDLLFGTSSAFFEGSVGEAVAKAKNDGVLIVVYLHGEEDSMGPVFADEMLLQHLKDTVRPGEKRRKEKKKRNKKEKTKKTKLKKLKPRPLGGDSHQRRDAGARAVFSGLRAALGIAGGLLSVVHGSVSFHLEWCAGRRGGD